MPTVIGSVQSTANFFLPNTAAQGERPTSVTSYNARLVSSPAPLKTLSPPRPSHLPILNVDGSSSDEIDSDSFLSEFGGGSSEALPALQLRPGLLRPHHLRDVQLAVSQNSRNTSSSPAPGIGDSFPRQDRRLRVKRGASSHANSDSEVRPFYCPFFLFTQYGSAG